MMGLFSPRNTHSILHSLAPNSRKMHNRIDNHFSDRSLKEGQAHKIFFPDVRQSPIAITSSSLHPMYELQNRPLILEYPKTVENCRLNNTGFSWEVKIPYKTSVKSILRGAHLETNYRYCLDQFHCHWGSSDEEGSEHTVDGKYHSAELHFVHYNHDKFQTISKAARQPDGLVVVGVFIDADESYSNHTELDKVVSKLRNIHLKREHYIIGQPLILENLLPSNRSYWSYQGSLTTPPYFESVTWFVMKQPIKCNNSQLDKFRNLKSSQKHENDIPIVSNHRDIQPLNGRTIMSFDETAWQ